MNRLSPIQYTKVNQMHPNRMSDLAVPAIQRRHFQTNNISQIPLQGSASVVYSSSKNNLSESGLQTLSNHNNSQYSPYDYRPYHRGDPYDLDPKFVKNTAILRQQESRLDQQYRAQDQVKQQNYARFKRDDNENRIQKQINDIHLKQQVSQNQDKLQSAPQNYSRNVSQPSQSVQQKINIKPIINDYQYSQPNESMNQRVYESQTTKNNDPHQNQQSLNSYLSNDGINSDGNYPMKNKQTKNDRQKYEYQNAPVQYRVNPTTLSYNGVPLHVRQN